MSERVRGKGHRWVMRVGLCGGLLVVVLVLFDRLVLTAHRTVSPTKEYEASFNRITKTITTRHIGNGTVWYSAGCDDPAFLWSPNGKYLARSITSSDGTRRAEIEDMERSVVCLVPTKSTIQGVYEQTRTRNRDAYECIEIAKWLDDKRVLIEFSWPSDTPGEDIGGSYVYEFQTYTIADFAVRD